MLRPRNGNSGVSLNDTLLNFGLRGMIAFNTCAQLAVLYAYNCLLLIIYYRLGQNLLKINIYAVRLVQFMAYTISKAFAYIITLYTVTSLDKTFKFFQALYILGIPVCTNLQEHCVRSIVKIVLINQKQGFQRKKTFAKKPKFLEIFFVYRKLSAKTMPNFAGKINLRQFHENCESVKRKKAKKRKLLLYFRIFSCFFIDFFRETG